MIFASGESDILQGFTVEELEREVLSKLPPAVARSILAFLRIPGLIDRYLQETDDPELKELKDFLIAIRKKTERDTSSQTPASHEETKSEQQDPQTQGPADSSPSSDGPAGVLDDEEGAKKPREKEKEQSKKEQKGKTKRTHAGARGSKDFPGAQVKEHPVLELCDGGACPCKQGKLYQIPPGTRMQFDAKPLLEAIIHKIERLRCSECGNVFGALLPPEITERQNYHGATPEAAALSALARYALGFPDLRLERLQDWQGCPLSNTRQWDIALMSYLALKPLLTHWLGEIANAPTLRCDDANQKVIELQQDIKKEVALAEMNGVPESRVRTGVQASIIVATTDTGNELHAFVTGREHQGEVLNEILNHRDETALPPCVTTDAASKAKALKPFPAKNPLGFHASGKNHQEATVPPPVVRAHCLEHLRLVFEDIQDHHPDVCERVLELIGHVYANDAQTKVQTLTPAERQLFHAEHSKPVIIALEAFLDEVAKEPRAEPNSPLGRAVAYARNHRPTFSEFLRTPGVALDSNACERDVYFVILHRMNSLHYQSTQGAHVGDFFMSVAATCRSAGINPLRYLSACLEFPNLVCATPQEWMPWNYETAHAAAQSARETDWQVLREERRKLGYVQRMRTRKDTEESGAPASVQVNPRPAL